MIKNLPKSLIDTAKSLLETSQIGTLMHDDRIHFDFDNEVYGQLVSVLNGESCINEAYSDWWKTLPKDHFNEYRDLAKSHFDSLTPEEHEAVVHYTYNSYPINKHLESVYHGEAPYSRKVEITRPSDKSNSVSVVADIGHLTSAVTKNRLPHDLVTYAGIYKPTVDDVLVHFASFISSSTDTETAHMFGTYKNGGSGPVHIAKMHHQKGHTGLYIGNNPELSLSPHEHEFIIPPRSNFKVSHQPTIIKDQDGNVTHYIWDFKRMMSPVLSDLHKKMLGFK